MDAFPREDSDSLAIENILCDDCKKAVELSQLLIDPTKGSELFRHFPTRASIATSASNGCHLCSIFLGKVEYDEHNDERGTITVTLQVSRSQAVYLRLEREPPSTRGSILGEFAISPFSEVESHEIGQKPRSFFEFVEERETSPRCVNHPYHPAQIAKSSASSASFSLATEWLRQCLKNHPKCMAATRSDSTTRLPSRLISVGPQGSAPRIVLTDDLANRGHLKYLALSHCWGSANIIRLVLNVVDSMKTAIPMSTLPPTFHDAVVITRRLGKYLWIDSLCIIQDSREDWAKESAVMGDVYSNADCTIAALTSPNSLGGCFTNRNPLSARPCQIEAPGMFWYVEGNPAVGVDLRAPVLAPLPLHTRAWVVQERLLAPRTIYYGTVGLAWECVECSATESIPEGEVSRFSPKASFFSIWRPEVAYQEDPEYFEAAYQEWLAVQISYTRCSLTKFEDKLIAISGVIKRIESRTGWTNIFGLWKNYFLKDLLWFVEEHSVRPEVKVAPSWSWASIVGRVMTASGDFADDQNSRVEWIAKVKEFASDPTSFDTRLQAPLRQVACRISGPSSRLSPGIATLAPEWEEVDWDPDVPPDASSEMWCMLVARKPRYLGGEEVFDVGLVLTPSTVKERKVWMRVGLFRQMHEPGQTSLFPVELTAVASSEITLV